MHSHPEKQYETHTIPFQKQKQIPSVQKTIEGCFPGLLNIDDSGKMKF